VHERSGARERAFEVAVEERERRLASLAANPTVRRSRHHLASNFLKSSRARTARRLRGSPENPAKRARLVPTRHACMPVLVSSLPLPLSLPRLSLSLSLSLSSFASL